MHSTLRVISDCRLFPSSNLYETIQQKCSSCRIRHNRSWWRDIILPGEAGTQSQDSVLPEGYNPFVGLSKSWHLSWYDHLWVAKAEILRTSVYLFAKAKILRASAYLIFSKLGFFRYTLILRNMARWVWYTLMATDFVEYHLLVIMSNSAFGHWDS